MSRSRRIAARARPHGLAPLGAFHPAAGRRRAGGLRDTGAPRAGRAGLLAAFRASPEYRDGAPDPLNRWSERVIGGAGRRLRRAAALPVRRPALAAVHRLGAAERRGLGVAGRAPGACAPGLFVSYRGALALPARLDSSPPAAASLRRLRRALPRRLPGRGVGRRRTTTSPPATAGSTPRPGATAWTAAAPCAGPARWGRGCGPRRNRPSTWRPFMAGRGHATADPHAPRQVELGRSRPARPRPAAEQARAARGRRCSAPG